jgi:hypothetical protein
VGDVVKLSDRRMADVEEQKSLAVVGLELLPFHHQPPEWRQFEI